MERERLCLTALVVCGIRVISSSIHYIHLSHHDFTRSVAMLATTKNGEPRHCPIPSVALNELKVVRQVGDSLIFPSEMILTKPFEFRKHWFKVLDKAGIQDFRFHNLRHTAVSYKAMNGMSLYETGTVLGHKDTQTTIRYAHLSIEYISRLTASAMSGILD